MRDAAGVPQGYDLDLASGNTTGAQREHRYDILKKQAEEKGLQSDVAFYLISSNTAVHHGGFGLGLDRFTMICST